MNYYAEIKRQHNIKLFNLKALMRKGRISQQG